MCLAGKTWEYIYLLSDPITNRPFYIGRSKNPIKRLGQHISSCGTVSNNSTNVEVQRKINELVSRLIIPKLEILAFVDRVDSLQVERELIEIYSKSENILNGSLNPQRHGKRTQRTHKGTAEKIRLERLEKKQRSTNIVLENLI